MQYGCQHACLCVCEDCRDVFQVFWPVTEANMTECREGWQGERWGLFVFNELFSPACLYKAVT